MLIRLCINALVLANVGAVLIHFIISLILIKHIENCLVGLQLLLAILADPLYDILAHLVITFWTQDSVSFMRAFGLTVEAKLQSAERAYRLTDSRALLCPFLGGTRLLRCHLSVASDVLDFFDEVFLADHCSFYHVIC